MALFWYWWILKFGNLDDHACSSVLMHVLSLHVCDFNLAVSAQITN